MPTVDTLDIQVSTSLNKSEEAIDRLVDRLGALQGQLSGFTGLVKSSTTSSTKGFNNLNNSFKRTSKSTFSLASAFGKFYANYFMVIRGVKKLWSSIEGTTDYIEALNYQNVAFGKIASEWDKDWKKYGYDNAEAYADSFTDRINTTLSKLSGVQFDEDAQILKETGLKNLGLNLQTITQYASQLASVTNSVGQTGEVSLAAADAFTKLAGDMSSLFNVDYSSVAKNLQSGLIGQSRALYKYGIDITNATLQTYAYELGLEKAVSEMTQSEKMQLRMLAILDQSKVSWGDLANTINSPSNMIRQFTTNLKEAGMVLGQLFLPVLQKVLPVMNGVSIAAKRLLTDIAGLLGIKIDVDSFGQGYSDLEEDIDGITDSLDDVTASAKKARAGLRVFDELNVINMGDAASGASGGGAGSIDLTQQILDTTEEYNKVWQEAYDQMENRAQEFANNIYKYFDPISQLIEDISIGDWFAVGEDVSNLTTGILNFFTRAIENVDWKEVGNDIGDFLKGINWTEILGSLGELIWAAINASVDIWGESFDTAPIETIIATGLAAMVITGNPQLALIFTLASVGLKLVEKFANWAGKKTVEKLFEHLGLDTSQVWEMEDITLTGALEIFFSPEFQTQNKFLHSLIWGTSNKFIKDQLDNINSSFRIFGLSLKVTLKESIDLFHRTGDSIEKGLVSGFENAIDSVQNLWNKFASWLNDKLTWEIDPISIAGKQIFAGTTISLGKIPTFYNGGFVPTTADIFLANENRVPELVGTIGGKTAVASGTEITGIRDAIYSTGQSEASLLQTAVGLLQIIAEKEFGISKNDIGRAARDYAREYTERTKKPAYTF